MQMFHLSTLVVLQEFVVERETIHQPEQFPRVHLLTEQP